MGKIFITIATLFLGLSAFSQNYSLEFCKELALENNKKLKTARLSIQAAEKVKKSAFTEYFPNISASGSLFRFSKGLIQLETPGMDLPVYDGNLANFENATQFAHVPSFSIETLDYANFGIVTAVQPIYAGGRIQTGNKLAELNQEITKSQYDLTADEIMIITEKHYWNLVALKEKKTTLEGYERLLLTLQKEVGDFYDAGLIKKSDLLQVKLELIEVNGNKLKLANSTEILKMAFKQHLGISYGQEFEVQDSIGGELLPPETYYMETDDALTNREEYNILNKAVSAEKFQKKLIVGEMLPELGVGIGGMYLDILDQDNTYGIAFASLSIPISDWWGKSYKKQEKDIKIKIAENNLKENSELLQLQMSQAYYNLKEAYKQIDIARTMVVHSTEYLKELEDHYDAGMTTLSDFLEARAMSQEAMDSLTDARAQYKIKVAEYLQALGIIQR